jgi:hypothetical protein
MATKLDYLKDLKEHPHSTGGEAAARLDIPEATILEGYRRARRQGLVEGDGGRPEKFILTDAGLEQLRGLLSEGNPTPNVPSNVEGKLTALEKKVNETIENVRGLSGLVERVLRTESGRPSPVEQPDDSEIVQDLLDEKRELEDKLAQTARVIEYYAAQIGAADFSSRSDILEARGEKLARQLDAETQQAVRRLVELEEELGEERNRWFGPNDNRVRKLKGEIAELREKLGFAALDLAEGQEEESEEAEYWPLNDF